MKIGRMFKVRVTAPAYDNVSGTYTVGIRSTWRPNLIECVEWANSIPGSTDMQVRAPSDLD